MVNIQFSRQICCKINELCEGYIMCFSTQRVGEVIIVRYFKGFLCFHIKSTQTFNVPQFALIVVNILINEDQKWTPA